MARPSSRAAPNGAESSADGRDGHQVCGASYHIRADDVAQSPGSPKVCTTPINRKGTPTVPRAFWLLLVTVCVTTACQASPPSPGMAPQRPVLTPAPRPGVRYVAVLGDSFTAGGRAPNGWARLVTDQLDHNGLKVDVAVGSKSGSGYITHGTRGSRPFVNQISDVVGTNDGLVILFGSPFDRTVMPEGSARLITAIQHTLFEVKKAAPRARIVVIGPAWAHDDPPADVLLTRDAVRSQALAAAATFLDPLAERWFQTDPGSFGPDSVSPDATGQALVAAKIAPIIENELKAITPAARPPN